MAQNYYSLEQAAKILGKSTEELVQMARKQELRGFADAGSWKFRTQDIDDRKRNEELLSGLSGLGLSAAGSAEDFDDLLFEDEPTASSAPTVEDIALAKEPPPVSPSDSATGRALQADKGIKGSGESDVRLIFNDSDDAEDSGISLVPDFDPEDSHESTKPPTDSDIRLLLEDDSEPELTFEDPKVSASSLPTEEFLADPAPTIKGSADSGLIPLMDDDSDDDLLLEPAPRLPAMSEPTVEDEFSFEDELGTGLGLKKDDDIDLADFDLDDIQRADKTPTIKQASGDDDSDSDFDLNLEDDIGLAQDIAPGAGDSGINLAKPDDSGLLLRKAVDSGVNLKSGDTDSSDSEFDVSLESDDDIFNSDELPTFKASDTAPRMSKVVDEDSSDEISDSDFELALDEEGDDESGSDVVALDEDEDDEDASEDYEEDEDAIEAGEPVMVNAQPAPWGGLWVGVLSVTTMVFVVVMMMMYEISRNAWSYHEPYPLTATIIDTVYETGKSIGVPLP
jgi:hypothetical protein